MGVTSLHAFISDALLVSPLPAYAKKRQTGSDKSQNTFSTLHLSFAYQQMTFGTSATFVLSLHNSYNFEGLKCSDLNHIIHISFKLEG